MIPNNADLLREYSSTDTTYARLGAKYGLNRNQVSSRIRQARGAKPKSSTPAKLLAFPSARLSDEKPIDWEAWQDTLATFRREGYITVTHDCDCHFGDHDEGAINMRYRLYGRKQPDLIVVGSDAADFDTISKFASDPDREVEDVLDDFAAYWFPHIDNLNAIAPRAVKVFILGNHDARLYGLMDDQGRHVRRTIEEKWLHIVRYGGVLWIGREQEVDVGPLLVKHGDKANEHVAKSLLEQEGYQVHVMAGHVHRTTSYTREGRRYPVTGVTSGCAQKLRPHYVKRKGLQTSRRWNHGVAFATVDMRSTFVDFDNIRFSQIDGRMVATCNGEVLEQAQEAA